MINTSRGISYAGRIGLHLYKYSIRNAPRSNVAYNCLNVALISKLRMFIQRQ